MEKILFSSVEGNRQYLDGGAMFGNVPRALWSRWERPDKKGRIELACRTLLIEVGNKKILCETGIGAFFEPKLAKRYGVQNSKSHELLKNLKTLGIKEEEIDVVILSHLHFDHAGGLLPAYQNREEELCFPKATYVVGEEAFERALSPHLRDRASFIPNLTDRLKNTGRLSLVKGNKIPSFLGEGFSFIITHGHTPGQMHVLFENSLGEKIFFAGDLIPGKAWVHLPITMGYDRAPEKLINEKEKIYSQATKEKWWIFFTHDREHSCARVRKNSEGHYEAYQEKKILKRQVVI